MAVKLYGAQCKSSRKAIDWFEKNNIDYIYRNVNRDPLSIDEIKHILSLTENGTEDILSKNSKTYKKLNLNFADLSLSELFEYVERYPELLRKPIMFTNDKLQIGFNESIRQFIPKEERENYLMAMLSMQFKPEIDGI